MTDHKNILVLNGGSSSIKFALLQSHKILTPIFSGSIENIGSPKCTFKALYAKNKEAANIQVEMDDYEKATNYLLDWLELQIGTKQIKAIGHRLVHGMKYTQALIISKELLEELKQICPFDPEHLPGEINLIESFLERYPFIQQVACFDTAFHTDMPEMARRLPLPSRYFNKGIQRYGFHGLSYAYLLQELQNIAGKEAANGKLILAHLGNGASLAAVKQGKSMDTSMGFTPASGLVMGSRTGDLDPGVASYLMQEEGMTPQQYNQLINHQSGLLGISETTANMQEIIQHKTTDVRSAAAFDIFCYQTKKFIGAYAAVLEGVDTIVFSGGIGEHSSEVRSEICDGLEFLGIKLDEIKNINNASIISASNSEVIVHVIKTNEQIMIAKLVIDVLQNETQKVPNALI